MLLVRCGALLCVANVNTLLNLETADDNLRYHLTIRQSINALYSIHIHHLFSSTELPFASTLFYFIYLSIFSTIFLVTFVVHLFLFAIFIRHNFTCCLLSLANIFLKREFYLPVIHLIIQTNLEFN